MQYLFNEVASLDQRCYEQFGLSEDLLMEHAADGMADYIRAHYAHLQSVTIVCGAGNNGADGIALARLLQEDYAVTLCLLMGTKSPMATLQLKRAKALDLHLEYEIVDADLLVDALFGSGISRAFDAQTSRLLQQMNAMDAVKIACDVPSGLHLDGSVEAETFYADVTLSMGALKRGMYSDAAKEAVGEIYVINLGIARSMYETEAPWQLLEQKDLKLPHRYRADVHKGSYGHLGIICGEKEGAAMLAGEAALRFGVGLVTLLSNEKVPLPPALMQSHLLPETTTALAIGMGLGQEFATSELTSLLAHTLPLLLDADIFAHPLMLTLLERKASVLTPHPKEFTVLLKLTGIADITVAQLQSNRFVYVERFMKVFPACTLVLKGANVIIAHAGEFYINPHGTNALAKGGSGDVLSGIIGALLAQGYSPLDAAISGSLAHTAAAALWHKNSYALRPEDIIDALVSL